ncbi:hypothetical protein D3C81_1307570 [compost metagenome]
MHQRFQGRHHQLAYLTVQHHADVCRLIDRMQLVQNVRQRRVAGEIKAPVSVLVILQRVRHAIRHLRVAGFSRDVASVPDLAGKGVVGVPAQPLQLILVTVMADRRARQHQRLKPIGFVTVKMNDLGQPQCLADIEGQVNSLRVIVVLRQFQWPARPGVKLLAVEAHVIGLQVQTDDDRLCGKLQQAILQGVGTAPVSMTDRTQMIAHRRRLVPDLSQVAGNRRHPNADTQQRHRENGRCRAHRSASRQSNNIHPQCCNVEHQ